MGEIEIRSTINGKTKVLKTKPARTLLSVLHDDLKLTSVKEGCGQGDCGACIVIMDGLAVNSCLVFAGQADGKEIITLEGLAQNGDLHPLQQHFIEQWAFQCGYCTPGMLMSCYALLLHNPNPDIEEIREAIEGNLCRCTNYRGVIEAVLKAAADLNSISQIKERKNA